MIGNDYCPTCNRYISHTALVSLIAGKFYHKGCEPQPELDIRRIVREEIERSKQP
jgi:hypothetical protein